MKTERELFKEWIKKEHTHIFNGAERGDNRFKMDIDFMYMAWQASAQREGYKLVPVEKVMDCLYQISDRSYVDDNVSELKAMIGAADE